jgi:hypothetical protein
MTVIMGLDNRIATRHVFESRIQVTVRRGANTVTVQGWTRDLSDSGLGAFVAENLEIGEVVSLQIDVGSSEKSTIAARVARKLGTQYGFQFTALSPKQRVSIQALLKGKAILPNEPTRN